MEEMNNVIENEAVEIVEEVVEKLTFGQNIAAYALAGTFVVGVATVGYFGYKGTRKLIGKFKSKKGIETNDHTGDVVDVEEEDIQDINDESENK